MQDMTLIEMTESEKRGVAILVSTHLRHQKIQITNHSSFESLFIEILVNPTKKLICGSVYRPPNTSLDQFLTEYEHMLKELKKEQRTLL